MPVGRKALGLLPDVAGPEVLTGKEILRVWKWAHGRQKLVLHLPIPSKFSATIRNGLIMSSNAHVAKFTWAQSCRRRYRHAWQNGRKAWPCLLIERLEAMANQKPIHGML